MKLRFDEYGDIKLDSAGHLSDVDSVEAEMGRFQMFFDTPLGSYLYDGNFGNNALEVIGLTEVTSEDLQEYARSLREHLVSSNLLSEYTINADFLGKDSLRVDLTSVGTRDVITWEYKTKTGRLSEVRDVTPVTEYNFEIYKEVIKATGAMEYDINHIISKAREVNAINKYDDVQWKHRLYINMISPADEGDLNIHYEINDIENILYFYTPVMEGTYIRLEIWPATSANLEATSNPYLMRKKV